MGAPKRQAPWMRSGIEVAVGGAIRVGVGAIVAEAGWGVTVAPTCGDAVTASGDEAAGAGVAVGGITVAVKVGVAGGSAATGEACPVEDGAHPATSRLSKPGHIK